MDAKPCSSTTDNVNGSCASGLKRQNGNDNVDCGSKPKLSKKTSIEGVELERLNWTKEDKERYAKKQQKKPDTGLFPKFELGDLSDDIQDNSPHHEDKTDTEKRLKRNHLSLIGRLSRLYASKWNDVADSVYHAFKVTSHIVNPNFLLRATVCETIAKYPHTIDWYLDSDSPEGFPFWSCIENDLMEFVNLFDGCEAIANQLRNKETAAELITDNILLHLTSMRTSKRNTSIIHNPIRNTVNLMINFFEELVHLLGNNKLNESVFVDYIRHLLDFYIRTTRLNNIIAIREGKPETLDLTRNSDGTAMKVIPDLQFRVFDNTLLVGEVKAFGVVSQYENSSGVQVKNPLKEHHLHQEDASNEVPEIVEEDDVEIIASDATAFESMKYFRNLGEKEKHKIDYMLPQLIAQMLAVLDPEVKCGHSRRNESVQLGFQLDAFKLRFVRLVLRDAGTQRRPSGSDVTNLNVRCEVFLTREMNLLNSKHLKMFFQILHSIVHASYSSPNKWYS